MHASYFLSVLPRRYVAIDLVCKNVRICRAVQYAACNVPSFFFFFVCRKHTCATPQRLEHVLFLWVKRIRLSNQHKSERSPQKGQAKIVDSPTRMSFVLSLAFCAQNPKSLRRQRGEATRRRCRSFNSSTSSRSPLIFVYQDKVRKKIWNRVDYQRSEKRSKSTQEIKRTLLNSETEQNVHIFEGVLFFKLRTT